MSKPEILNILIDDKYENTNSSLLPTISWQYFDATGDIQDSFYLKIGTYRGGSDIVDTGWVVSSSNQYIIPSAGYSSVVKNGLKYYVTLLVQNSSDQSSEKNTVFVVTGDYWANNVDNSTGWTIEYYYKLEGQQQAYNEFSEDLPHHYVEINDGAYSMSVEMYADRIRLLTSEVSTYFVDNTKFNLFRIVGQEQNVSLYVNGSLAVEIIGKNSIGTTATSLKFAGTKSIQPVSSLWSSILIKLDGARDTSELPDKLKMSSVLFNDQEVVDIIQDISSLDQIYVATNPQDISESGKIYRIHKNFTKKNYSAEPILQDTANKVIVDSDSDKWTSTSDAIYRIVGEKDRDMTFNSSLDNEGNLDGFERVENCTGVCGIFNKLLRIDTLNENSDAFWYYKTLGDNNSSWYKDVSNSDGWMVEADLRVVENINSSESVGFVINDGAHEETIFFQKDKVRLKNANISQYCDLFSSSKTVRVVGKNDDIFVYLKSGDQWGLLIDASGKFLDPGQVYSDSGIPSISATSYHEENVVWHSKKDNDNWQIFLNSGGNDKWGTEKQLTFDDADNFNPDIAVDEDGVLHLVYQTNKFGSWEIIYLKYNGYRTVQRIRLTNATGNSIDPKICLLDNGDMKIVWLDDRNGATEVFGAEYSAKDGSWISSSFDYNDFQISNIGGSYVAKNIRLSGNGTSCAAAWDDNRNIAESVFISSNDGSSWSSEIQVTSSLIPASNPDVKVDSDGKIHVCWIDSRFGVDQVFYNTLSQTTVGLEEQISSGLNNAEEPAVALFDGEISVGWISSSSVRKIYHRRTVDGIFSSNIDVFGNSDVSILDFQIMNLEGSRENRLLYRASSEDGYISVMGYKLFIQNSDIDLSEDISSGSVKISNLKNTKSIAFGDIAKLSTNVSEWAVIKYFTDYDLHPLIIKKWSFNNVVDFTVDDEKNLYVIDNDGLHIFSSTRGEALISNQAEKDASLSAPSSIVQISVSQNNYLLAHDGSRIFYHLPISSKNTDKDMEWFEIDSQIIQEKINFVKNDPGGLLWIGTSSYSASVDFDKVIEKNVIESDNITKYANGYFSNSINFGSEYIWISVTGGIFKINRYNNTISQLSISDGLIDADVKKTVPYNNVQWSFGDNGLVKIADSVVSIYRGAVDTELINDIFVDSNGIVWIAGNSGLEYFDSDNLVNYVIEKEDGFGVVLADNAYKNYSIETKDSLDSKYHHLVKVNGVFRNPVDYLFDSVNKVIIFRSSLSPNSSVELVYYKLVEEIVNFDDPTVLIEVSSTGPKRITSLEQGDYPNQILASLLIDGDSYVYKLLFGSKSVDVSYPFGTIIYDKTPPLGTLDISDQISASQVVLDISASDNVSGVNEMVISKFANFTSDGTAPLSPVPYAERVVFDLGSSVGTGLSTHEFVGASGSVLHTFSRNVNDSLLSELFAGSSLSAKILKFNVATRVWENVENLSADYVYVMTTHLGKMYIGTGGGGKLFSTEDGLNYSLVTELTDPSIYSLLSASDDRLYIGTGDDGKIYTYDGISASLLFDLGEVSILDMVEFSGYVYVATGDKGRIYRYNISSGSIEIVFDDADPQILSLGIGKDFNSNSDTVYAGTQPNGKILRYVASRDIFAKSFESVLNGCRSIKSFNNSEGDEVVSVYSCVDDKLLQLGKVSWDVVYIDSSSENIQDMEIFNGEIFVITGSDIKTVSTGLDKSVYVKFIDFAGNETVLYAEDGSLKPRTETERLFDILSADDQAGFSLQNRILIVNNSGSVVKSFIGSKPFFSADKIDEEIATYDSEVFNGTNNLVSWDTISYISTTPTGTSVEISIRSADIESEIDSKDWSDPIESGRDISGINGKYIQFKALLKSSVRGVTPVLDNVTITSKTTFAVHYFTTNFVLSSNLKSGLLVANTVTPVGTELIFGVNSNTSTNWSDYQIIEPNKTFLMSESNKGKNLKIGVKFLSTTADVAELHEFGLIFCTENGELVKLNLQQ